MSEAGSSAETEAKRRLHEQVFNELMHEVKHGPPGARLSQRLRAALERMSPSERRAVVSRTRDGCAPLLVAARRGAAETVEYLVYVCDADLEQRGLYQAAEERAAHSVTALWAAAVGGQTAALRALADAGADIDAPSDSGSTPLRSACFMTHLDVVRFLCERGADIHKTNHHGGTCLINSVQSPRLCRYLLSRGARIDACDAAQKTVLHYAVQEQRADTARLLLAHGAPPHARDNMQHDALQTACIKGARGIVSLLESRVTYSAERLADAYELLGATQLDELNDAAAALASWRRATSLRHQPGGYISKRGSAGGAEALGAREWRTERELAALAEDADALRTQALLVAVRVMGRTHRDTVFRLMYRGAAYADSFRYQRCIDLWMWALELRIERDTLLYSDTCHTACALTRLMVDAGAGRLRGELRHEDVVRLLRLLLQHVPECQRLLRVRPWCASQAEAWERALRCVLHVCLLALRTGPAPRDDLRRLVALRPRTLHTQDTLLHLACSRLTVIRSSYFTEEPASAPSFPSVCVARALLASGADPRARNAALATPLHVAAVPYNFSTELVEALLSAGAHVDTPDRCGDSAAELVPLCRGSRVRILRHRSLACLAAAALLRAPPTAPARLPPALRAFLDLHRALPDADCAP